MTVSMRKGLVVLIAVCAGLAAYITVSAGGGAVAAPRAGTVLVHVKQSSLTDQSCNGQAITGAHFVINQISSPPATITVRFRNGDTKVVPLMHKTRSVAQYTVTFPAGRIIVDATAYVPSGWSGQFVLSNYLCGPAPTSTPPSSSSSS